MTPEEFAACCEAHHEHEEREQQEEWERTRIQAVYGLYPHVKGTPTPQRVMPFPWDRKKAEQPRMTKEERHAAFEDAKRRMTGNGK